MLCNSKCTTCLAEDICFGCVAGYFLFDELCIQYCPDGYYGNAANNTCVSCDSSCKTCRDISTKCTSCDLGRFLY